MQPPPPPWRWKAEVQDYVPALGGLGRIMGTVSLWAKALSFTGVQALKVAALCRGGTVLSSTLGPHNKEYDPPRKERPHPGPAPPTLEAHFSVALAVGCPVSKYGLFPVSPGELLFRAFIQVLIKPLQSANFTAKDT